MHGPSSSLPTTGAPHGREQREAQTHQVQASERDAAAHHRLRLEHDASCLLLATLGRRHAPLD